MMKKLMLAAMLFTLALQLHAQEEDENTGGFKKENLFTGGNVIASFYTGGTTLGLSPHFGYSITNWLDAAVSLNFVYTGEKDEFENKYRQTNFGPGAFVRIFPVKFLFVQSQYEHNFQTRKLIYAGNAGTVKEKLDVNSLLLGAGYSSGKEMGNTYYYFALMFDVLKLYNSPYIDPYGRMIPVIRAGFNIGLFQGRGRYRDRDDRRY